MGPVSQRPVTPDEAAPPCAPSAATVIDEMPAGTTNACGEPANPNEHVAVPVATMQFSGNEGAGPDGAAATSPGTANATSAPHASPTVTTRAHMAHRTQPSNPSLCSR